MNEKSYQLNVLKDIAGDDDSFILEMINTFRSTLPELIDKMKIGFEQGDYIVVKNIAHQIKPSVEILQINALQNKLKPLELHCAGADIDRHYVMDEIKIIDETIQLVIREMNQDFD